jgi:antitoxin VapB
MEAAMGLNIKDETVHRLAREVADLTGDSMTGAIRRSLEEKLDQLKNARQQDKEERLRKLREITGKFPPPQPGVTSDHSDLYDDDGLPA